MQTVITPENLRSFAYCNDAVCARPYRGVALDFIGLGGQAMHAEEVPLGRRLAEKGILYVIPYLNPWNWMSRFAARETDEILDALFARCGVPGGLPVASTGGSMGGLAALAYMHHARHTPVACIVNCPVCDLPYHYTERPDLPRTLYSAFGDAPAETLQKAMEDSSPLHLVSVLPKAQYVVFHCEADRMVSKRRHSDRFVAALRAYQPVEYHAVPDRDHCDLTPEARAQYELAIERAFPGAL